MKKFLIILLALSLFFLIGGCLSPKKETSKKEIVPGKIIIINDAKFEKEQILRYINIALRNLYVKKFPTDKQLYQMTEMIYFGSRYFGIDYRDIIAIITIESEWNYLAYQRNQNGTDDFGLCQINTSHLEGNYKIAKKICDQYKIYYTNSIYDINLNILSAFIHLNDGRNEMINQRNFNWYRWIVAYNVGVAGSLMSNRKHLAQKYWNKFIKIRRQLI